MFNEYSIFQMMRLRQEEVERKARDAWKYFVDPVEKNSAEIAAEPNATVNHCCQCACA